MKRLLIKSCVWILAGLTAFSCSVVPKTYSIEDTKIVVKTGHFFSVKLKANPTTGYQWAENIKTDAEMLELTNSDYQSDKPVRTGSGGWQYYTYKGLKPGNTKISLKYWRSWEPNEVNQIVDFEVIIK